MSKLITFVFGVIHIRLLKLDYSYKCNDKRQVLSNRMFMYPLLFTDFQLKIKFIII